MLISTRLMHLSGIGGIGPHRPGLVHLIVTPGRSHDWVIFWSRPAWHLCFAARMDCHLQGGRGTAGALLRDDRVEVPEGVKSVRLRDK
ncbi:hypothetical protein GCM10010504_58420 [Streptomyces griseus]|nr:hypothetical protein GCM10010504_58420 [Streptomyces griseus]